MSCDDEPPVLLPGTVPPEFVKGGGDWLCMFNPSVRRVMDIKQQAVIAHDRCALFSLVNLCTRSKDSIRQVYSVSFSLDCSRIAIGVDSSVYLYDVRGSDKHEYVAPSVLPIALHRLIPFRLRFSDVNSGERSSKNPVHSVAFSPDGTLLAAASDDMLIRVCLEFAYQFL